MAEHPTAESSPGKAPVVRERPDAHAVPGVGAADLDNAIHPGMRALVYALFLASGATALIYQVAWVRTLSLIFGASFEAISIVLASFMAGLALGGFYFGRKSSRIRRPLRLYGLLEIGVAVFALFLPWLLELVNRLYIAVAMRSDQVTFTVNLLRVVLAFCVLVLPTFFMGGTLPVLARYVVHRYGDLGRRLSGLYAINTFGAVVGTVGAGFLLLPQMGVWRTQLLAVAGNVIIGLVAIVADRSISPAVAAGPVARPSPDRGRDRLMTSEPVVPSSLDAVPLRLAFWGTAFAGLGALSLEVMWTRAISIAVGTTTYSFTVMLAAFLVGIALGSAVHALFPLRRVRETLQFGLVFVCIGLSTLAVSQLIPRLPEITVRMNLYFDQEGGLRTRTALVLCFMVMLVPCFFMGIAFPLAGQARARLKRAFGESVGDLVGLNTAGTIAGSLGAGFVLIPYLGLQNGTRIASAVYLGYGLIVLGALVVAAQKPGRRPATIGGAALVTVIGVGGCFLVKPWNDRLLATFRNNESAFLVDASGRLDIDAYLRANELLYHRYGQGSTVAVEQNDFGRVLIINGKAVASDHDADLPHELMLGHLPVLLHPNPKSAIVIGLGAGVTLGSVAAHPGIDQITLVEIEPAVLGAARYFAGVNNNAMDDPRVRIAFQDGRNFLATTRRRFDVITADPIHPWAQGAGYLYTSEFYAITREHLTDTGVMCQWLPLYELSPANIQSIARSFVDNFPYNSLWQINTNAILIGSRSPIRIDMEHLARRLDEPAVAGHLARIGLDRPLALLSQFTMDDAALREFCQGARVNRDDNLYIEFSSPLSSRRSMAPETVKNMEKYRVDPRPMLTSTANYFASDEAGTRMIDRYRRAKSQTVWAALGLHQVQNQPDRLTKVISQLRAMLVELPEYGPARRLLGQALQSAGSFNISDRDFDSAITHLRQAITLGQDSLITHFNLALALQQRGQIDPAIEQFRHVLRIRPDDFQAHRNLAGALMRQGRIEEAETHFRQAIALKPAQVRIYVNWSNGLLVHNRVVEAIVRLRQGLDAVPNNADLHNMLARVLAMAGHSAEALKHFGQVLRLEPDSHSALLSMAWLLATHPDPAIRDARRAVELAERAARLADQPDVSTLDTLAAAYAADRQFAVAVERAKQALQRAAAQGMQGIEMIRRRLELYKRQQPFIAGPPRTTTGAPRP